MFKAGAAAVLAAMTMWCAAASAATTITDPAGDANGGANAGLDQATGPVNDAARDLTKVVVSRDSSALSVAFTTSAPVDQGPFQTFVRLNVTTPTCPVSFIAYVGGTSSDGSAAFLPIVDAFDCGGFLNNDGYSISQTGNTVVARFPYSALQDAGVPVTASTALTGLKADTFEGTAVFHVSGCSGDPTICLALSGPDYRQYLGALVDKAS